MRPQSTPRYIRSIVPHEFFVKLLLVSSALLIDVRPWVLTLKTLEDVFLVNPCFSRVPLVIGSANSVCLGLWFVLGAAAMECSKE